MATPTFRSAGTWSFTANNVATPFTATPGAPAGKAVGDLLLLVCESGSNTATVATPSGWTLVTGFPVRSGTSLGGTIYVFMRIADGTATDTPSPVWSGLTTGTSGTAAGAGILAWQNAQAVLDVAITSSDLAAQTTTSTIPAVTTAKPESLVVGMAMKLLESSGQTSTVSGRTERADNSTTSGTGHIIEVCDVVQVAPGATPACTVTWSFTTSGRALALSIALLAVMPALTDTGLTITDSISRSFSRTITDTGLTVTDSPLASHIFVIGGNGTLRDSGFGYSLRGTTFPSATNWGNTTSDQQIAVPFTPSTGGITISAAEITLFKQGSPTDAVQVQIQTDSGGLPSGTVLATSATIAGSTVSIGGSALDFVFASPQTLASGTTYWFVVQRTGAVDASNFYKYSDIVPSAHGGALPAWAVNGGNALAIYNGTTWTPSTHGAIYGVIPADFIVATQGGVTLTDTGLAVTDSLASIQTRPLLDAGMGGAIRTSILDNFNRADGPLGSAWTAIESTGYPLANIASNAVTNPVSGTTSGYWNATTFGPDCEVYASITGAANKSLYARVSGYHASAEPDHAYLLVYDGGGTRVSLWKSDGTGFSTGPLGSGYVTGLSGVVGLWLTCIGNVITGYTYDGTKWTQQIQATDSSHPGAGNIGFVLPAGTGTLDDFGGGTLAFDSIAAAKTTTRSLTDTGMSTTQTLAVRANRALTDTGLTVTESIQKTARKNLTDTGLTTSDSLVATPRRVRSITDTGVTVTDSTQKTTRLYFADNAFSWDEATNRNSAYLMGNTTTDQQVARSFTPASNLTFSFLRVCISTFFDSPTDNVVVAVQADSAGSPSGTDLFSASFPGTRLTGTNHTVDLSVGSQTLTGGTTYWVVFRRDGALSDTSNFAVVGSINTPGQPPQPDPTSEFGLTGKRFDGAVWNTSVSSRFYFGFLANPNDTLAALQGRPLTDTGLTVSDSIAATPRRVRALTDTGVTVSDSIAVARVRVVSLNDAGLSGIGFGPGPYGSAIIDNFNRADAPTLGSGWTALYSASGYADFQVISNQAAPSVGGPPPRYASDVRDAAKFGPDCEVFATSALGSGILLARMDTLTNGSVGYGLSWDATFMYFLSLVGGTGYVQIGINIGQGVTAGDRVALVCRGSTLEAWIDVGNTGAWAKAGSLVDTTHPNAAGYIGLFADGMPNGYFDDFGGGSLAGLTDSVASRRVRPLTDQGMSTTPDGGITSNVARVRALTDSGLLGGSPPILDPCNRSEDPLSHGGNWTGWAGPQLRDITTSATAASGSGSFASSYWNVQQFTDCESYATVVGASGTRIYLYLRASADASVSYLAFFDIGTTYGEIHNASGFLSVITANTTLVAGDVIAFSAVGTTLTARQNGAAVGTATDSTIASGYLAMAVTTTGTNGDGFNNFGGGSPAGVTDSIFASKTGGAISITDTGLTVSDTLASRRTHLLTDTGLTVSDSLARAVSRALTDTGATITTTLASLRLRPLTDTGLTTSDSIAKSAARAITDTGLTESDSVASRRARAITDTGLTLTDSIQKVASKTLTDTGVTVTTTLASLRLRPLTDTGLTVSDSIQKSAAKFITDTGATIADAVASAKNRTISDVGLALSETIASTRRRALSDTGATITDSLATTRVRALTDTGLTLTDSLAKVVAKFLTDTGLTLTDSVAKSSSRSITDTGATVSDSIAKSSARSITDTGLTTTDALASVRVRAITDTGLTLTDSTRKSVVKFLTDTGLTTTDSIARTASRAITDTGVTVTDSTQKSVSHALSDQGATIADAIASAKNRAITDVGLALSESIQKSVSKFVSDTGLTVSDSTATVRVRAVTDTGATVTDSLAKVARKFLTDTGLTVSDSLASSRVRALTDTGLAVTDSIQKSATKLITDTGLAITDALAKTAVRALTDTGLTTTDTLSTVRVRSLTDTGLAVTDSTASSRTHFVTDTGATITDSISAARGGQISLSDQGLTLTESIQKVARKFISDTGLTVSDSLVTSPTRVRSITDTGLTVSDSIRKTATKFITDTGLTVTDSTATVRVRALTDTGLTVSDSIQKSASKFLTDTGLTLSDSLAATRVRPLTDTGLTITDSTQKSATKFVTDTGLSLADAIASSKNRPITDVGLALSESIASTRVHFLTDTGLTTTDSVAASRNRAITDTGLSLTDSTQKSATKFLSDTGLTVSDSIAATRVRLLTDTGLAESDTTATRRVRAISDTGLTITDVVSTGGQIVLLDTGLTVTDSIRKTATKFVADTGLTVSDSIAAQRTVPRSITDTGAAVTDSTATSRVRAVTDTGATIADALTSAKNRAITDVGLALSESIRKTVAKFLADTGATITDSLAATRVRSISDTGLTVTDSTQKRATHFLTDTGLSITDSVVAVRGGLVSITDTGLTLAESIQKHATHSITDTGVTTTDSIAKSKAVARSITDQGATITDSIGPARGVSLADTGLSITDSTRKAVVKFITATGVTITDSIAITTSGQVALTDTGVTITDSIRMAAARFASDTGVANTDSIVVHFVPSGISITDQGLTFSDTLVRSNALLSVFITDTGLTITDTIPQANLPGFAVGTDLPTYAGADAIILTDAATGTDAATDAGTITIVATDAATGTVVATDAGAITDRPGGIP